jgi:hypothetical protein
MIGWLPIPMEWITGREEATNILRIERPVNIEKYISNTRVGVSHMLKKVPNNRNEDFYG